MPSPFWFLFGLVVLAIVVSVLWQVFNVGELFAGANRTQRLLFALLGLIVIVAAVWWFFSAMPMGGLP